MKRMIAVAVAVGICLASMLAWAIDPSKVVPSVTPSRVIDIGSATLKVNSSFSQTPEDYMVFSKGKTEFVIFGRLKAGETLATVEPKLMYLGIEPTSKERVIFLTKACAEVAGQTDAANGSYFSCTFNPSDPGLNIGKIRVVPPKYYKPIPDLVAPNPPPEWKGQMNNLQPLVKQELGASIAVQQPMKPVDVWLPVGTYWFVAKASTTDKSPAIVIKKLIENYVDANSDGIPDNIIPPKAEDTTGKDTETTTETTTEQTTDQTGELNTSPVVTPSTTETTTETAAEGASSEGGGMCTLVPMAAANPLGLILLMAAVIPLARRKK